MPKKWLTVSECADRFGLAKPSIYQAAREGRLEWNGKTGRECRVRGKLAEPIKNGKAGIYAPTDLSEAKLAKLNADTALQEQRLKENREAQWRAYADATCEDYLGAFAPLSARLTEMRLTAPKLASLRKVVEECTADFLRRQKRRYEDHEPENA